MGINFLMFLKQWFVGDVLVFEQLDLCGCMRYWLFAGFS